MSAADYSYARPGGAALRAAGITSVGRYLAPPGDGRALELPELNDLRAHDIDVWLNREGSATSMLGGYSTGVYHGQTAAANLRRLGLDPKTTVVYASADFDAQPSQFPVMDAYMDGFTAGLGSSPDLTGTYGSMPWINHCRQTGKATWFWQSASTSFTHGQTGFVHIQQTTLPSLAGTDNNILHTDVYGQIGASVAGGGSQPFDPKPNLQEDDMPTFIKTPTRGTFNAAPGVLVNIDPAFPDQVQYVAAQVATNGPRALVLDVADADLENWAFCLTGCPKAEIPLAPGYAWIAAITDAKPVSLTDAQVQTIAQAVVAALPQGTTAPTADEIAAATVTALRADITAHPFQMS